ncbi:MAG TPA: hypothetical protein VGS20_00505 [Candidatus Acidoferrales bacterium]|nr:hypothetical protein [Candidatus Acidoferrales bacterium]
MAKARQLRGNVFLNVPYDEQFHRLYLAYISGISAFGLVPRTTLEIPGGARRLDCIFDLIQRCRYSIHDLSRVQLDISAPRTPRFNMPFELGLSVAWARVSGRNHTWFVFEAINRRLSKSLSDLNGTDPYVHDARIGGVFRELCNCFVRRRRQPSVQQMRRIYREVRRALPEILRRAGTRSSYQTRVFKEICVVAEASATRHVT